MLNDFLANKIIENFPFPPTEEQEALIKELASFPVSHENHELFLLKGFAGTGKTSVIRHSRFRHRQSISLSTDKILATWSGVR